MNAEDAVRQLGGVATLRAILALTTRHHVRLAEVAGLVERTGRGRYRLGDVAGHRRTAAEHAGVMSGLSAAQHHGWAVKHPPGRAWVTVPRNRKVSRKTQAQVHVLYADLAQGDHEQGVTRPLRTVLDCARQLPFDEALAVADSALREQAITHEELRTAAATMHGPGGKQVRRVAAYADARAANPFESVLRALAIECGLAVEPQVPVPTRTMTFRPDLVDARRRIVVEADSWEFHSDRQTHDRDCVRHTALALAGWLVLRFTWSQVMHSPSYVRAVLTEVVQATPATMAG